MHHDKDDNKTTFLEPESLSLKFLLATRIDFDKRIGRKHRLVYCFLLDYYHSKYGDALASVRHIAACLQERDPFEKGLYIGDIHGALTDLVEWGYVTQEKGSGRRASRYTPVWGDVPIVFVESRTLRILKLAFGDIRTHVFGRLRTLRTLAFVNFRTKTLLP
jgi:hypothetical protein